MEHKNKKKTYNAKYSRKIRKEVFDHYGHVCKCCGEKEEAFLTIDHVKGKGNIHRREIKKQGHNFYHWLIKKKFPRGYQTLCHNCNFAKSNGGCPHKSKKNINR